MPQYKDIPCSPDSLRVRVDLGRDEANVLRVEAATGGYSLAALCRIGLTLLAQGKKIELADIMQELDRIRDETVSSRPPRKEK